MAPLGARRLDEQAGLALRLAAIELVCAAQAIDLRQSQKKLGVGTHMIYSLIRMHILFLKAGESPQTDLRALCTALEQSCLSQLFAN